MTTKIRERNKHDEGKREDINELIGECIVLRACLEKDIQHFLAEQQSENDTVARSHVVLAALEKLQSAVGEAQIETEPNIRKYLEKSHSQCVQLIECLKEKSAHNSAHILQETVSRFGAILDKLQCALTNKGEEASECGTRQALLATFGKEIFGFPIESVVEILRLREEELFSVDGNETVSLRGHVLSLIDGYKVLRYPAKNNQVQVNEKRVVVIAEGEKKIGVIVHDLLGEETISFKMLPTQMRGIKGVQGVALLENNRMAVIIDPHELIVLSETM